MRFKIFFASMQLFAPDMRQIEKDKPLKNQQDEKTNGDDDGSRTDVLHIVYKAQPE